MSSSSVRVACLASFSKPCRSNHEDPGFFLRFAVVTVDVVATGSAVAAGAAEPSWSAVGVAAAGVAASAAAAAAAAASW
eukprot:4441234-Prorocentrum_lima.AAC.1